MFKLREDVTSVSSNWQSNFEVKRSNIKVTGSANMKVILAHILAKNVLIHYKTKTSLALILCCTFHLIQCSRENAQFPR